MSDDDAPSETPYDPWVAEQVHEQARKLLGSYIQEAWQIEWQVGSILQSFYDVPAHREMMFLGFLGGLTMSTKIDALRHALVACKLDTSIIPKLQRANGFRNLLAHSGAATSEGTFTHAAVYYFKTKDGHFRGHEVTLEKFDEWISFAKELSTELRPILEGVRTATAAEFDLRRRGRVAEQDAAGEVPSPSDSDPDLDVLEEEPPPEDPLMG